MKKYRESDFDVDNYDEFYESHHFAPIPQEIAADTHRHIPRVSWALDVAKELKPKKILDLGCLDGFALLTLLKHTGSGRGIGVDLSEDGINHARTNAQHLGLPATFKQGAIESFLNQTADKFDLILLFEVIEHVKDPDALLKKISEVLTPDGTLLISTPSFEAPTFGKNDVKNKCHIRLYTTAEEDYEEMTDVPDPDTGEPYMRTATSMVQQLKDYEIIDMDVISELINVRATHGR